MPPRTLAHRLVVIGAAAALVAVLGTLALAVAAALAGHALADSTYAHAPLLSLLRAGFLVVALGALVFARENGPARDRSGAHPAWTYVVVGAAGMLAASLAGDVVGMLARFGVIADQTASLGDLDSVQRRLFRLAHMASRAVPLLALLAALECSAAPSPQPTRTGPLSLRARAADLLVRFEPWLFTIGATTLATILAASAFINKELAYALPIGADTTVAGCAAAAIRARRRADRLAFGGWLAVAVSMGVGLLMGTYSFGGPLPDPPMIGAYGDLARTVLRDAHVASLSAGVVAISVAAARKVRPA